MMRKLKVYIAGPYSKGDVVQNVRDAIFAANELAELGLIPFIPHLTHFWHFLCPHELDFWYAYDLEWLNVCDVVLRLPGESSGADEEVAFARQRGMTIYSSIAEIRSILTCESPEAKEA